MNSSERLSDLEVSKFLEQGACIQLDDVSVLVGWGGWQWSPIRPSGVVSFYVPDFYLESPLPWATPSLSTIISIPELTARLADGPAASAPDPVWEPLSPDEFAASFHAIQDRIAQGGLVKAVPVAFELASLDSFSKSYLSSCLQKLLRVPGPSRLYGIWDNEGGILGRTPEVLFHFSENLVRSVALAGTRARSAEKWDDAKEIHEHSVVVEDVRRVLQTFGEVSCSPREIISFSTLEHFQTGIQVILNGPADFAELAVALHPTAALGVYPRTVDWKILKQWDGISILNPQNRKLSARGRFGAPFGFVNPSGYGTCLVAIRNIQWSPESVSIGSGCGIVKGSQLQREWFELKMKRETIKKWLGL